MTKRVFQIYRYDPDTDAKPRMQTLEVELDGSERMLLDALMKLKAVDPSRFHSLQHAWDAHKVRNQIAHSGSAFPLTERLAHRTIAQYEVVMREHGEI